MASFKVFGFCMLMSFAQAEWLHLGDTTLNTDIQSRTPSSLKFRSLPVSTDSSCGANSPINATCLGSTFGDCCSSVGFCGGNSSYCDVGCQSDYGHCLEVSTSGSCGSTPSTNITCVGSQWGNCCSSLGYCGGNSSYCGTGCQTDYGDCGTSAEISTSSILPSSIATSSASTTLPTATVTNGSTTTGTSLSKGAKAGIGTGVGAIALGLIGVFAWWFFRRSKHMRTGHQQIGLDGQEPRYEVGAKNVTNISEMSAARLEPLELSAVDGIHRHELMDNSFKTQHSGLYKGS